MAKIELRGLEEALEAVDNHVAQKAARRTINDLCKRGRTALSRHIRETYNIRAGSAKAEIDIELLGASGGRAALSVSGTRMPLTDFSGTRQVGAGLSVQVRKDRPRSVIRHGFLATMGSGGERALRRQWRRLNPEAPVGRADRAWSRLPKRYRLPAEQLTTLSVPQMFDQDEAYRLVQAVVDDKGDELFQTNYRYFAERMGP